MRPNDDIDFTTLTWVKGELDETLKQAQLALEAYVEAPADASQMRFCATYLHQVQGTLRMVELYGAAMVTEEMEQLASALLDNTVKERDEAYAVLMRGIVQLPDYLERLQSGHKDIPIVLLPLLNDLRAARGEKGLSEIVLFTPDLGRALPPSAAGPAAPLPEQELRRYATTLRGHFQIALLKWFKNDNPDQNIATLAQVCDKLVAITAQEEARRLFWVAASVLDALRAKAFEPSPQLRQTIGKVEREIKRLADAGENSFRVDPPRELTRNLLYFVAHAPTDHGRIGELRQVFNLDALLPSEAELDHARGSMSGHNRALLDTVSAAIKDDLMRVKDALDLYLRTQDAQPANLSSQVDILDRVSDTLGMLGLGVARRVVVEQRDAVHQVASGHRPANESSLLDIAGALLYVEATLDDQVQHLGRVGPGASEADAAGSMQAAESRRVLEIVVKEAQNNFAAAKAAFVAFIESSWDHAQLESVPSLMGEVAGAMRIVELSRPAQYLDAVKVFTQVELLARRRVPAGTQMETLADVLASLEYFLEALGEHRAGREKILDVAQRSLEALGYWPVPVTAVAPTDSEIAAVDAHVANAIAASEEFAAPLPLQFADTPLPPPSLRSAPPAPAEPVPETVEPPAVEAPAAAAPPLEPAVADAAPSAPAAIAGFEGASDEIDDEIREVFVEEVQEEIANLEDLLPTWKADPANMEHLKSIRRVFHTLKGSGRLVGALTLGEFSWKIENMLNRVLDHTIQPTPAVIDIVDHAFNALPELLSALRGNGAAHVDLEGIKAVAERVAGGEQVRYEPRALPPLGAIAAPAPVAAPVVEETPQPAVLDVAQAEAIAPVDTPDAAAPEASDFDTFVFEEPVAAVDAEPVAEADAAASDAAPADAFADIAADGTVDDVPAVAATEAARPEPADTAPSIAVPSIDPVLFDILKSEVAGHLDTVDAYLAASAHAPQPISDHLLRAVHTMNGAFAMTDVPVITDVLGPLEGYFKRLLAHGIVPAAGGRAVLVDTAAAVRALMVELEQPQPRLRDLGALVDRIVAERDALPEAGGPAVAPLMPADAADEPALAATGPALTEAVSMPVLHAAVTDDDSLDVDALEARLDDLLGTQPHVDVPVEPMPVDAVTGLDDVLADARHPEFDLADELALTDTTLPADTLRIEDDFLPVSDLALDDDALVASPALDPLDAGLSLPDTAALADSPAADAPSDLPALDALAADLPGADAPRGEAADAPFVFDLADGAEASADVVVTDDDRQAWAEAAHAKAAEPAADAPLVDADALVAGHGTAEAVDADARPFEFDADDQADFEAELLGFEPDATDETLPQFEFVEVEFDGTAPVAAAPADMAAADSEADRVESVDAAGDVAPPATTDDAELLSAQLETAPPVFVADAALPDATADAALPDDAAADEAALPADDADLHALIAAFEAPERTDGDALATGLAEADARHDDADTFADLPPAAIVPPAFEAVDLADVSLPDTDDLDAIDAALLAFEDAAARDTLGGDAPVTLDAELADIIANVPGATARTPDGLVAVDSGDAVADAIAADTLAADDFVAAGTLPVATTEDADAYWNDIDAGELEAAIAAADQGADAPAPAAVDSLDDFDWEALELATRPDADVLPAAASATASEADDAATLDAAIRALEADTPSAASTDADPIEFADFDAAELEARLEAAEAELLAGEATATDARLDSAVADASITATFADAPIEDDVPASAAIDAVPADAAAAAPEPIDDLIFRAEPEDEPVAAAATADAEDTLIFDDADDDMPATAPAPVAATPVAPRPDPRDLAIAAAFLAGLDDADPDPDAPLELADMDEELLDIFLEEGGDLLDHSDGLMAQLRDTPEDREAVVGLQRDLHTLKGGARMAGIAPVGDLSHAMESLLEAVAEGRRELPVYGVDLLQRAFDRLHGMVTRVGERRALAMPVLLIERVEALVQGQVPEFGTTESLVDDGAAPVAPTADAAVPAPAADTAPRPATKLAPLSAPIDDTLGDDDDITARLPQEQIRIRADLLDRLVNYAGEVAIYRARLEQQLGLFRGNLVELEQTTLRLREQLRKLEIETEAQIASRYQREAEMGEQAFDPLELDRFSTLQQLTRALSESAADLVNLQGTLDDHTRQYETLLLQQSRVSSDLQEGLMRTRMVPFDSLVPRLRRIIRQTGTELGKKAQLKVDGAQGEMDRNVLERMTAPLEHMLRNALAHGLEVPADRVAAGKADEGTVRIQVLREGSEVVIKVTDDGRGLDRDAIRNKAIARGLLVEDAPVTDRDLYAFILEPGFSTAETVSKIAGRGVGMDVVHSEIRQLGGTLQIDSERGRGTVFTIRLPFTLAVTQAVFVKQGETSFAVPIASVQGVARIDREELDAKLAAGDAKFVYAGEEFMIHDMGLLLGDAPVKAEGSLQVPLLLARSGDQRAAICVDQVIGSREIVVKPVGPQVGSIPGIFGATIMGDGRVIVILDVAPLVRRHVALRKPDEPRVVPAPVETRRIPLVMVVDDSITMRKVTSRVLERHSYEVLTAKDGVDAIEKLADRVPDVMLLDIEMPRMDGYELATHMRNDIRLRGVPIIMITSRTGEKHRQRAFEIGVDRYLGKPYQEAELMRNVQEILKVGRGEPA